MSWFELIFGIILVLILLGVAIYGFVKLRKPAKSSRIKSGQKWRPF